MPFLRSVALFFFAAFSIAKAATCSDFDILANGISMNALGKSSVNYSIMIGENLEFRVSPVGDVILWTLSSVTVTDVPSYSPPIGVTATGNIAQEMVLAVTNCGVKKNIVIDLAVRPYKVTFDIDGGKPPPPMQQTVIPGELALEPLAPPTKDGYRFVEWQMPDGTAYDFSSPVTSDITLKAAWTPRDYTITFAPQGGEVNPGSLSVIYNTEVGTLPTPTKTGYDFDGWYSAISGGVKYTDETVYTDVVDITLYARWTPIKYTITFEVDCLDGTVNPTSKLVAYKDTVGTLPTPKRAAHEFKGWYSAGGERYTAATIYEIEGPITLYARWEFIKGTRPVIELLDFTIPTGLVYNGLQIASLPTAVQKYGTYGLLGDITILYNGKDTPPKDAGTYAISVFIAKDVSEDYDTATVSLGSMTIDKAPATATVTSATVKPKVFDRNSLAEIDEVTFSINPLYASDAVSLADYIINAKFALPCAGNGAAVNGTISWHPNGPLSKNYIISPSPLTFNTTANITQATGKLEIIDSLYIGTGKPLYEYTRAETYPDPRVEMGPFISGDPSDSDEELIFKNCPDKKISFEYKMEGAPYADYSDKRPHMAGYWFVKAKLDATTNYTGDEYVSLFLVTRGNAKRVAHKIEFSEDYFTEDSDSLENLRRYYEADTCEMKSAAIKGTVCKELDMSDTLRRYHATDLCGIKNKMMKIRITMEAEPDIYLMLGNNKPKGDREPNLDYSYSIPFSFGRPGLDTLIYTLVEDISLIPNNILYKEYKEYDTLLIESPIAFDSVAKAKWNNVLFINKESNAYGGYKFTDDFEWFKKDNSGKYNLIGNSQFYSAGPRSTDVLNPNDVYKVTMHTKDGIRISTCEGNPKKIAIIPAVAAEKPAVTKQVLGINGKTAKPEQKVYDIYGVQRKETPAGVYIIKDK